MNIAVFVKHVPDTTEAEIEVAADGRSIKGVDIPYQMNEWDRYALEEAIQLRERSGGRLTAFLLGEEDCEESLRRCLAVGADRAVRVWDPAFQGWGPWATALALRSAVGEESFDLLLCGAQASDDGFGIVGPAVAELLGVPSAALVNELALEDGRVRCTRELEGGTGEVVELDLPALVTVQTGINEPRYVSILGIRKACKKPIDLVGLPDLGLGTDAMDQAGRLLVLEVLEPLPPGREAEILEGTPDQMAERFVSIVKEKGGVL